MILKKLNKIKYRRGPFTVCDNFLSIQADDHADINYFIQCPENFRGALNEFHTLLIALNQSEEKIQEGIYHRTRSEINSFTTNQNFEYKMLFPVPAKELTTALDLFNTFAKEKKIRKAETNRIKAYNKNGILALTFIEQDNKILCINFYRLTSERATNLYSFSTKNELAGKFNNTHLGRAHRALHWLDIIEFKKAGAQYYDFGGWYEGNTNQNLLNINKFKEQFTQNRVKEYTGVIYTNRLLRFLLKLRKNG